MYLQLMLHMQRLHADNQFLHANHAAYVMHEHSAFVDIIVMETVKVFKLLHCHSFLVHK